MVNGWQVDEESMVIICIRTQVMGILHDTFEQSFLDVLSGEIGSSRI